MCVFDNTILNDILWTTYSNIVSNVVIYCSNKSNFRS